MKTQDSPHTRPTYAYHPIATPVFSRFEASRKVERANTRLPRLLAWTLRVGYQGLAEAKRLTCPCSTTSGCVPPAK